MRSGGLKVIHTLVKSAELGGQMVANGCKYKTFIKLNLN
jgi:hypothetical protein